MNQTKRLTKAERLYYILDYYLNHHNKDILVVSDGIVALGIPIYLGKSPACTDETHIHIKE